MKKPVLIIIMFLIVINYLPAQGYENEYKKENGIFLDGFDLFYTYFMPGNQFLKKHFPKLAGIGATFHYSIYKHLIVYHKYNYTGLFNSMKDRPVAYTGASLFMGYFHQGVRAHYLYKQSLNFYIQAGWHHCYYSETASNKTETVSLKFDGFGFDYGGGVKYMINDKYGSYIETIIKHIKLGEEKVNLGSINLNMGLFAGF